MIQNKLVSVLAAVLFGSAVFISGCGTGANSGTGSFQVRLHDAPAHYDSVKVHIDRVEVNRVGSPNGWTVISEPDQTYDLISLSNGAYAVLGEAQLEPGTYHQVRLVLNRNGHSVVIGQNSYEMNVPSGQETGIKLEVNAEIEEDIQYVVLLDFDASRSVVETGSNNPARSYLLKPVVKATNNAVTGNIEGTVSPAGAEPVVYAIAKNDTLASAYADTASGYFKLIGLEAGSYTVSVDPTDDGYETWNSSSDVEVTAGETHDLGSIVLTQN